MIPQTIDEILSKHRNDHGGLIGILQEVQSAYGYLPREVLEKVAEGTGRSLVDVYAVATFFKAFSLKPRGKHLVRVCLGTACHVRGAGGVRDGLARVLGIQPGETTADGQFTLETVNCLGACALGPIVMVDQHCFSQVDGAKVTEIVDKFRNGRDRSDVDPTGVTFEVDVTCPSCGVSLMDPKRPIGGHPSIHLETSLDGGRADLWCCARYGDPRRESSLTVPEGTVLDLSCPHCRHSVLRDGSCPECGSSTAVLWMGEDCALRLCARYGCNGHMLDIGRDSADLLSGRELSRTKAARA